MLDVHGTAQIACQFLTQLLDILAPSCQSRYPDGHVNVIWRVCCGAEVKPADRSTLQLADYSRTVKICIQIIRELRPSAYHTNVLLTIPRRRAIDVTF